MKRAIRIASVVILLAGLGAVGVSYFYGSLRVQREAAAYLDALERCAPFEQQAWAPILRDTTERSVAGVDGEACVVTMEALGAGRVQCRLTGEAVDTFARFIQDGADTVGFLGGQTTSLRYSSENPDPMSELLNGPDCSFEG